MLKSRISVLVIIVLSGVIGALGFGTSFNVAGGVPGALRANSASPRVLPIIPGGFGFGFETVAGSGRHLNPPSTQIFRVTHLGAEGEGSLQNCIRTEGPRTCVFEVSGTIDLTNDRSFGPSIDIRFPYLTIAGQTAPSPGITIRGKQLRVVTHDVLIQHIRFRMGDDPAATPVPIVRHAIEILLAKGSTIPPRNIVIDHCSISWGIDETITAKSSASDITISQSIISEGLFRSLHPKGSHSMGLMMSASRATVARNIFAHTNGRTPLDTSSQSVIVNNLFYNTGESGATLESTQRVTSVVGNVRIRGPDSKSGYAVFVFPQPPDAKIFADDNLCDNDGHPAWPCVGLHDKAVAQLAEFRVLKPPVWHEGAPILRAAEVEATLLRTAGARPADRDAIDRRIISDIAQRTGSIPDCVGPEAISYPTGTLARSSPDSAGFEVEYCFPNRFEGMQIEVSHDGRPADVRDVVAHDCQGMANVKVQPPFSTQPAANAAFRIINSCSKNAGGWPDHVPGARRLDLPADPNRLTRRGYTRLEEHLHEMAKALE